MIRMQIAVLVAAVSFVVSACGTSEPASDASDIDIGSGKSPDTAGGGTGSPAPADTTGTPKGTDTHGTGSVPDSTPKPGGGSTPGAN
jgi:hypothetical protein